METPDFVDSKNKRPVSPSRGAVSSQKFRKPLRPGEIFFSLVFGSDHHRQLHVDVRVQMQGDRVIANRTQGSGGQTHFSTRQLVASLGAGFGNVGSADRAEQLAFGARLGGDLQLELLERGSAALRILELIARDLFQL